MSRKKGRWEAKVMVNRKWAYRELFNSEEAAGERPPCWEGLNRASVSSTPCRMCQPASHKAA